MLLQHKFNFIVNLEDGSMEKFETKAETGVQAWVELINKFGLAFNCGAVVAVYCEVDSKDE